MRVRGILDKEGKVASWDETGGGEGGVKGRC